MRGFTEQDLPELSGKCFLVTGANAGIGFATARMLARRRARVLLGCRSDARAVAAIAAIRAEAPHADLAHVTLDLGNLASVRDAAAQAAAEPRLDGLVNNAGIMTRDFRRTADGFEQHIGINHLGHFALTLPLLPKLAEAGGRVVITSSLSHPFGRIDFARWQVDRGAGRNRLYADSKFACMLFLLELDQRLRRAGVPVEAIGCHPGFAATDILRDIAPQARRPARWMAWMINDAREGAWPALQAACDPSVVAGGYYGPQGPLGIRGPSGPACRSARARDAGLARQVWERSAELTATTGPAWLG